MLLVFLYAEVEVDRCRREPRCDIFRPLDGEAKRRHEKILQHQRVELVGAFEAVGVKVDERARAAVQREDRERRTRDGVGHAEATREALHEGRFTDPEIAVERERGVGRQRGGELDGERLRLGGGRGRHAGAKFIVDARSHGSRRG